MTTAGTDRMPRPYASILRNGDQVKHVLNPGRHAWVQVDSGAVRVNGLELEEGDGLALSGALG